MKKKFLLIAMMVAILTCIFVLSVSAETITYEGQEIELVNNLGDPSWYTGDTASKITDKESIVILKDANGGLTAYPSYYVFRYLIEGSTVRVNWADQNGVDYSFINENDDKNYQAGSLYYVELPYGITLLTNANLWGDGKKEPNVVEFVFPDSVTLIQNNAFTQVSACKKITMSKNLKTIEMWSFYNSANLETIVFPKDCAVESIDKGTFNGCTRLANINLENCTSLKTLGDGAFQSCRAIDRLALPDSIETIGFQALYDLGEIELASDYLPKSLKSVDQYFLNSCKLKNNVLYFPQGFTSLTARYCFAGSFEPETSLTLVFLGKMTSVNLSDTSLTTFLDKGSQKPIKLVFAQNEHSDLSGPIVPTVDFNGQKGFIAISNDGSSLYTNQEGTLTVSFENANYYNLTGIGADANGNTIHSVGNSPTEIIFCGGDSVEISYTIRCNHTDKGWYRFHTTSEVYDMDAHETASIHYNSRIYQKENCGYDGLCEYTCVVCGLESEEVIPATGKHEFEADTDCSTEEICDVCKKVAIEALMHDLDITLTYENGYTSVGARREVCKREGCTHDVSSTPKALVTFKGYSKNEAGSRMCVGYDVNHVSMVEYKTIHNLTNFEFGTVMSTLANAEDGAPLEISEGKVVASAPDTGKGNIIKVELTDKGCASVEAAILGDYTNYQDLKLLLCAYIYDGTTLSYVQDSLVSAIPEVSINALPVL